MLKDVSVTPAAHGRCCVFGGHEALEKREVKGKKNSSEMEMLYERSLRMLYRQGREQAGWNTHPVMRSGSYRMRLSHWAQGGIPRSLIMKMIQCMNVVLEGANACTQRLRGLRARIFIDGGI